MSKEERAVFAENAELLAYFKATVTLIHGDLTKIIERLDKLINYEEAEKQAKGY